MSFFKKLEFYKKKNLILLNILIILCLLLSIQASIANIPKVSVNLPDLDSQENTNSLSAFSSRNDLKGDELSEFDPNNPNDLNNQLLSHLQSTKQVDVNGKEYYLLHPDGMDPIMVDENVYTTLQSFRRLSEFGNTSQFLTEVLQSQEFNMSISSDSDFLLNLLSGLDSKTRENKITGSKSFDSNIDGEIITDQVVDGLTGYSQALKDKEEYFRSQWDPDVVSSSFSQENVSSYEESVRNLVSTSGIQQPNGDEVTSVSNVQDNGKYKLIENEIYSKDYSISEKKFISEDITIQEKRAIIGSDRLVINQPDMSFLGNLSVPVLASQETIPEIITKEQIVNIGFDYSLPGFDWDYQLSLVIIRFHAWANFHASLRWVFPVKFIIQYPSHVIQGQDFTINVTLIPLDLDNFMEFEIGIKLDVGFSIDNIWIRFFWYKATFRYFEFWPFGCWCWRKTKIWVLGVQLVWNKLWGYGIDFGYLGDASYKTPLFGETAWVDLPLQLDIFDVGGDENTTSETPLSVFDILGQYIKAGIGLEGFTIHGDSVLGKLAVYIDDNPLTKTYSWRQANQAHTTKISGLATSNAEVITFSLSELQYVIQKISLSTYLFIGPKNFNLGSLHIPLGDLIPPFKIPLPSFNLPGFPLASNFVYTTSGPNLIPLANYDFDINFQEISPETGHGAEGSISSLDHVYTIEINNPGGAQDIIFFEAIDLPPGYTAKFFPSYVQVDGKGPKHVTLVVYSPQHVLLPPGLINFNVKATSKTKQDYSLSGAYLVRSVPMMIPEISAFEFNLADDWYTAKKVDLNHLINVEYAISNTGNLADTYTVNASLKTSDQNRTWTNDLFVNPNQLKTGKFNFTFSLNDIYPNPGIYTMEIQAVSQQSPEIIKNFFLYFNFSRAFNVTSTVNPTDITIDWNYEYNFTLNLTNFGNSVDNFSLMIESNPEILQYIIYSENVTNLASMTSTDEIILLKITKPKELPAGDYDIRITLKSLGEGNNTIFSVNILHIKVLIYDDTPPGIVYMGPIDKTEIFVIPRSTIDLGPRWKTYDRREDTYAIYINDSLFLNSTWTNGTPVLAPVTGSNDLSEGFYNVTIVFSDGRNLAVDQKMIQIVSPDVISPSILPNYPNIVLPVNFNNPNSLEWYCREDFLFNLTLYKNSSIVPYTQTVVEGFDENSNNFTVKTLLSPGSFTEGIWNYTLVLTDMGNNTAISTITVIVTSTDSVAPQIITYPNQFTFDPQNLEELLLFNASDDHASYYELFANSTLIENSTWNSLEQANFSLSDINIEFDTLYSMEIYIYDKAGNFNYSNWFLMIIDEVFPVLLKVSNQTLEERYVSDWYAPFWEIYDQNPGSYEIWMKEQQDIQSTLVDYGIWTIANSTIRAPITGLDPGIYTFNAIFTDSSNLELQTSFTLTIIDTLTPYIIPLDPIFLDPSYGANWFEFFVIESHLSSYDLLINGLHDKSGSITNVFPIILIDLAEILPGLYNYTLMVYDESGNVGTRSVSIDIADYTPPSIIKSPDIIISEGSTGNFIEWTINEPFISSIEIYVDDQLFRKHKSIWDDFLENFFGEEFSFYHNISMSLDWLTLGVHKLTLVVEDNTGLNYSSSSFVSVVDITIPKINHLSDCQFKLGEVKAILNWEVDEIHPYSYKISLGSTIFSERNWEGEEIKLVLVGWSAGTYIIQLEVFDTSGNSAFDSVRVKIIESETTTNQLDKTSPGFEIYLFLSIFLIMGLRKNLRKRKNNLRECRFT